MYKSVIFLIFLSTGSAAQPAVEHRVDAGSWATSPTTPAYMNERFNTAAIEYQQYAPIPRIAISDLALPADQTEYERTGGYGVLLVSAISQEEDELPPKRITARIGTEIIELKLIASSSSNVNNASVANVFGLHRWDGLYAMPAYFIEDNAVLEMDFAKNRVGFVFEQFQDADKANLLQIPLKVSAPDEMAVSKDALIELIEREFPGFLSPEKINK